MPQNPVPILLIRKSANSQSLQAVSLLSLPAVSQLSYLPVFRTPAFSTLCFTKLMQVFWALLLMEFPLNAWTLSPYVILMHIKSCYWGLYSVGVLHYVLAKEICAFNVHLLKEGKSFEIANPDNAFSDIKVVLAIHENMIKMMVILQKYTYNF